MREMWFPGSETATRCPVVGKHSRTAFIEVFTVTKEQFLVTQQGSEGGYGAKLVHFYEIIFTLKRKTITFFCDHFQIQMGN